MDTLVQLSRSQLKSSLQANKVLVSQTRAPISIVSTSSSKEILLEQDLLLQKTIVEAQWLDNFNMYAKLTKVKAKLASLKAAYMMQLMPTQWN